METVTTEQKTAGAKLVAGVGGRREPFVGRRAQPSMVGWRLTEAYWGPSELVLISPRPQRSTRVRYTTASVLEQDKDTSEHDSPRWAADCHCRLIQACREA